ncbi:MAG: hybrid sensor histidine kinase/response regulator [Microcoleaceae cyanobacterium]
MTTIETDDQAYEFFITESSDLLQKLETGLINLSQDHALEKLHDLMRAAHSIKGGAACVGLNGIGNIAHDLENAIRALYADDVSFDVELEELLLQAYDCLRSPLQQQIETGSCEQQAAITRSQPIFKQLETKLGRSLEEAAELPEVPMETDMTVFLFEEEIPAGLRRWEGLLAHPQPNTIVELKTQAEVFATLGGMLTLPGFSAIAETALKALQIRPAAYQQIGQLALADFWAGHAAVMAGDRVQGGSVSPALVKLSQPQETAVRSQESGVRSQETAVRSQETGVRSQNSGDTSHTPHPTPHTPNPIPQAVSGKTEAALGLRIDVERFDAINQSVGDLATQDNSLVLQNQKNRHALVTLEKSWKNFQRFLNIVQEFTEFPQGNDQNLQVQPHDFNALNEILQQTTQQMNEAGDIIYEMKLQNLQNKQLIKTRQQTLQQVQQHLIATRMLPIESILNRFPRMIRDLSVQYQKPVDLILTGKQTLVDKAILEKLYDPLIHLVRNAFDHGIESEAERQKRQKKQKGRIEIKAYSQGNSTYIEVSDNGRGINPKMIRKKIIEKRLISQQDAARLSRSQLYEFLFYPGFSTKNKVSQISGRGVGLDVARQQIEALKGTLILQSEVGKGTTFIIRLPWNLTITKLLIFRIKNSIFAISIDTLTAILSVSKTQIKRTPKGYIYNWSGQKIPLVQSLLNRCSYGKEVRQSQQKNTPNRVNSPSNTSDKTMLLVISQGLNTIALKIDQVIMEQHLTIKPFSPALTAPSYLYGCTILGDGRLVPVIDSSELLEYWQNKYQSSPSPLILFPKQVKDQPQQLSKILIIDDSITTRQSLNTILKQSGYQVIQATTGKEGLIQLQRNPDIQVVLCDLEMPEMNGFEFLSRCRRKFDSKELPVLILTSRTSDRYRQLAKQLGSNGYMTKPWLKQELMKIIEKCIHSKV